MEAELKKTMTEFAEATIRQLEAKGLKVTPEMFGRKTPVFCPVNVPLFPRHGAKVLHVDQREKVQRSALVDLRRRLRDRKTWEKCREQMCNEWMATLFAGILRKREMAGQEIPSDQLLLPGFEHCPATIGRGKYRVWLGQAPIRRFLPYEARYQTSAQRNQQRADELHRIAEMVRPYEETDPDMAIGEAMRKAQAAPAKKAK